MAYTTINKSTDYFNTLLYTGDGSGTRNITGVGHNPDLVWIKDRGNSQNHSLTDAVRGGTKNIVSNLTNAESTSTNGCKAFVTDGFTIGSDNDVNGNSRNYVAWNWKANGQGSANTDGSINTTYTSVNTTAGFSISTYTGTGANATIGHGLGVAPKFTIIKRTSGAEEWSVQSSVIGLSNYLVLNSTNGSAGTSGALISAVSSTTLTVDSNSVVNGSGSAYVAYCFAEKTGYSKFGSYVGNGNADGAFVYTGFKPAWVMRKYATGGSASGEGWEMLDSARSPSNVADERLKADSSGAESTGSNYYVDFLSNGFKCRTADNATNNSGATYIYMAFAEAPLVGTNNVPCTAR